MVVDWNDTQTYWLNVLNAAVGISALVGMALMVGAVAVEMVQRLRGGAR